MTRVFFCTLPGMSEDGEDSSTPRRTIRKKAVVVSRERFDTIPRRRQRYIVMYLAMMAMWVATTVVGIRTQARNEEAAAAAVAEEAVVEEATAENETAAETPVAETTSEEGTATAPEGQEPAPPVTGDFTQTTKTLLEQRPIRYLQVATVACMVLFYLNFIGVLYTMGYSVVMILGICFACFFPLPGLLVVALIDRRVSKAWYAALPDPD
ncbi:MAG: hypothetical protein IIB38_14980 [Candidatus Hydrogenedentes bacterium]|nr:hypothetical protein [Candidatus Hydrogenedentota bacterium]